MGIGDTIKGKAASANERLSQYTTYRLLRDTAKEWVDDDATRLAAAVAYYTIFSLAPLIVLAVFVAGFFFGEAAAQGQVSQQLEGVVGSDAAGTVESMVQAADRRGSGIIASVLGIVVLLFGASRVFGELKTDINRVWEVEPAEQKGIKAFVKKKLLLFLVVVFVGILLLLSLLAGAVVNVLVVRLDELLPGAGILWRILQTLVAIALGTLLFGVLFKALPDAQVAWSDVWVGGAMTAVLFEIGKYAFGLYLAHSATASIYGSAGAVIVILLMVYYAALIFFFGAEFTQVYANQEGSRVRPEKGGRSMPGQRAEAPKRPSDPNEDRARRGREDREGGPGPRRA